MHIVQLMVKLLESDENPGTREPTNSSSSSTNLERFQKSAMKVFLKYVKVSEDEVDATKIFSLQCFNDWLSTKKNYPKKPAEAFRKTITGHVRGDTGLQPFAPEVEQAILKLLKKREIWPCFRGSGLKIGLRGFQTPGFWETKQQIKIKQQKKEKEFFGNQNDESECETESEVESVESLSLITNQGIKRRQSVTQNHVSTKRHKDGKEIVQVDFEWKEAHSLTFRYSEENAQFQDSFQKILSNISKTLPSDIFLSYVNESSDFLCKRKSLTFIPRNEAFKKMEMNNLERGIYFVLIRSVSLEGYVQVGDIEMNNSRILTFREC